MWGYTETLEDSKNRLEERLEGLFARVSDIETRGNVVRHMTTNVSSDPLPPVHRDFSKPKEYGERNILDETDMARRLGKIVPPGFTNRHEPEGDHNQKPSETKEGDRTFTPPHNKP
jgi:hypothetical protein